MVRIAISAAVLSMAFAGGALRVGVFIIESPRNSATVRVCRSGNDQSISSGALCFGNTSQP